MLVIPVFIPHMGCPHQCVFCNQHHITDSGECQASSGDVERLIAMWLARSPGKKPVQVAFYGGSFTCLPSAVQLNMLQAVRPFLDSGQVEGIRLSTRPDCIDSKRCAMLRDNGVRFVELGIQSLTDKVLALARRGHSAEQGRVAFRQLVEYGFEVGLQFMPGLPGETRRSFLKVIDEVVDLHPAFVRLYPAVVIKNSEMQALYQKGMYCPMTVDAAVVLTAKCCEKLEDAGIRVVRMGLQPTDALVDKVVAGPYHPSFGELVRSRLWLKKIRHQLAGLPAKSTLQVVVSHRDISAVVGIRKKNIKRLDELGFRGRFELKADPVVPKGQVQYVVS